MRERGGRERTLMKLGATSFLTHRVELGGMLFVDACTGFNDLIRLEILWNVRHCCPVGGIFSFKCYKHWAQILIRQPGDPSVMILSREGVTQGDLLSIVLCGIPLALLVEDLQAVEPGLLTQFYAYDALFIISLWRRAQLLNILIDRGSDWGYFPEPSKSLFIADSPEQGKAENREFAVEKINLYFVGGSRYLGAYIGHRGYFKAWVKPNM